MIIIMINYNNIYIESEYYSKDNVPQMFIDNGYFKPVKNNYYQVKVCGIKIFKNTFYCFLPKGLNLNLSDKKLKEIIKNLFLSLIKYKNEIFLNEYEIEWLGKNNTDIQNLNLTNWLIEDYINNGLYRNLEIQHQINGSGQINWSKTIKEKTPFVNNRNLLYLELITKKKNVNKDEVITKIHNNVIKSCYEQLSWLSPKRISLEKQFIDIDKRQQIIILEKALKTTFIDREIKLFQNLISYLKKSYNQKINISILTPYFYWVWETMLKKFFNHDESLMQYMPKPYWNIENKKIYTEQIPDILVENKENFIILDAKYYSIKSKNKNYYPGWPSIVKQLYYNLSISYNKNIPFEKMVNIFLMPGKSTNKIYNYIGKTSVESQENNFGFIYAFSIDINFIMENYIKNLSNKNQVLNNMINDITILEKYI